MRRDRFGLSCALEHEQLRYDGYRFKEDGEWPENLYECEVVVEDECEDSRRPDEIFYAERVDGWVVCWPKGIYSTEMRACHSNRSAIDGCSLLIGNVLIDIGTKVNVFATLHHAWRHVLVTDFHKVEHITAASDEEELHKRVIQRYPFSEKQAHVARYEDEHVKSLCFEGDAYDASVLR